MSSNAPVVKKIIHKGQKYVPIANGSKAQFHFQTWKLGKKRVLLDDSRKIGKKEPMVLIIGNKFKMEVWEAIVKMMAVGEVASFKVNKDLVFSYPFVSKTLRELGQPRHKFQHSCTMTLHTEGIGFPDLDDLLGDPSDLEFIIELLKVEGANEYEKEVWQLSIQERIDFIPVLKDRGNQFYGKKEYDAAEQAYSQAIAICEQLMVRERKGDEEWVSLNRVKLPILLNYTQCKLVRGEFYPVIEHCTSVLEHEPENEKALYRRAKAHVGAWNPDEAENDFKKLKQINQSNTLIVDKELENLKNLRREKEQQDKDALKKLFKDKMNI